MKRAIGWLEVLLGSGAALVAGLGIVDLVRPLPADEATHGEWTPTLVGVALPFAAAFAVAGIALLRSGRWTVQIAPLAVALAAALFFVWADRWSL